MRVRFDEVFQQNPNGSYVPRCAVRIGGVTMSPGVSFGSGVVFSGVDIAQYAGKDLDVEQHPDGTVEIKGIFQ